MSSRLEQFIRDHREEFDGDEPGKKVWDHIQDQVDPGKREPTPVIWLSTGRLSVAAAVSLLIAGSVWFFTHGAPSKVQGRGGVLAGSLNSAAKPAEGTPAIRDSMTQHGPLTAQASRPATGRNQNPAGADDPAADYQEEMYYYARLVELKHKELRSIEKDEPLLYKQFAGDVKKLDSVYRSLEKQLPENPNREQLLEAMLQNLQLQMRLLNHQLYIIKKINHSKKTAYEQAYKTV